MDSAPNILNVRKKLGTKEHVVFERTKRNLAITIDPTIVAQFSLVAGLDAAIFSIENGKVTITFHRRGLAA